MGIERVGTLALAPHSQEHTGAILNIPEYLPSVTNRIQITIFWKREKYEVSYRDYETKDMALLACHRVKMTLFS